MATTVNAKGQVTIPRALRDKYGFTPGTKVVWIERDREVILLRLLTVDQLYGYCRTQPGEKSLTEILLEERRADREREDAGWPVGDLQNATEREPR